MTLLNTVVQEANFYCKECKIIHNYTRCPFSLSLKKRSFYRGKSAVFAWEWALRCAWLALFAKGSNDYHYR